MHALVAQGTEHRIPDPGVARSNRVRGASGPSPSGRASRPQREGRGFEPRRLHDMRHAAACKRRHSEERRHVKTARPRDGIRRQRPPAGRARDGGAGRPVRGPARADVVQRQHARFPSRRPRVRTPSSALSGKPKQWIRSDNGTRSRPFHVDASGKTWTNSPGMGTQRQGIRKHAIAPVAQRKSRCLLSTGSGYRNSVGARCLVNRQA